MRQQSVITSDVLIGSSIYKRGNIRFHPTHVCIVKRSHSKFSSLVDVSTITQQPQYIIHITFPRRYMNRRLAKSINLVNFPQGNIFPIVIKQTPPMLLQFFQN